MAELPKFTRTRLERPSTGPHPDANLISAFVENSLTQRERADVLQHLAQCAECRAVVGYAMPEADELPVVAPTPEQRSWARWTMMRWVTLATSAVVIAIAVLVLRPHQPPIQTYAVPSVSESSPAVVPDVQDKANSQSQSPGAADKTEKEQQAKPAEPVHRTRTVNDVIAKRDAGEANVKKDEMLFDARNVAPAAPGTAGAMPQQRALPNYAANQTQQRPGGPYVQSNQAQVANQFQNVAPPQSPADAMGKLMMTPSAQSAPTKVAQRSDKDKSPPPASETVNVTAAATPAPVIGGPTAKAKVAPKQAEISQPVESRVVVPLQATAAQVGPMARWRISADGRIIRSEDQGNTWAVISVAQNVVFRAVSANRGDIWAGGSAGALYHSTDGGDHWTRVRPVSQGVELTSDITRIEFTDAQRGVVTAAGGDQWATTDGGNTWSLVGGR